MPRRRYTYRPRLIPCTFPGCKKHSTTVSGLKRHLNSHANLTAALSSSQPSESRSNNHLTALAIGPSSSTASSGTHAATSLPSEIGTGHVDEMEFEPMASPSPESSPSPPAPRPRDTASDASTVPPLRVFKHPYLDGAPIVFGYYTTSSVDAPCF